MELIDGTLQVKGFLAVTLGIVVLFAGKRLNDAIGFLRNFSIPEPVSGGLLFTLLFMLVYTITGIEVEFDLAARDILLVYFFTTIGINASFRDLLSGGKPLIIWYYNAATTNPAILDHALQSGVITHVLIKYLHPSDAPLEQAATSCRPCGSACGIGSR